MTKTIFTACWEKDWTIFEKHIQSQYDMVALRDLKRAVLKTRRGNLDVSKNQVCSY